MHRDQFDTQDNNDCGFAVKSYTSNENTGEDVSGICSPPLWKTSTNPYQNYSQLSATAKTQAIARGQEELMEMIKNMPESSYELSLKDIVEHNNIKQQTKTDQSQQPCKSVKKGRMNGDKNQRSGSVNDGAFLLKIVFPFDLRLKGKKRGILNESIKLGSFKVSPRSNSVRSWDGLPWFGENEMLRRSSSFMRNIKRFGSSSRSSSKNNRYHEKRHFICYISSAN